MTKKENRLEKFWNQQLELALEAEDGKYADYCKEKVEQAQKYEPKEEDNRDQPELLFYPEGGLGLDLHNPVAGRYRLDDDVELYLEKKPNWFRRLMVRLVFGARWIDGL